MIEEYYHVQPVWKFALLCVLTFGIYEIYWFYQNWNFIKEFEEREEIMPFWRSIFIVFFGQHLFSRVLVRAQEQGYQESYSSGGLLFAFFILTLLSRLPDPLWLISLFSFLPLIPVLNARNYFFRKACPTGTESTTFTGGEVACVVLGTIFFGLVVIGLAMGDQPY
ncbi:hypothetical protein TH63_12350 [Rufibacter radiotolerans]|uniref:DUF4234 domain-containing protein n=1 Tax=Rufibacter radiotolerans TaxID=1379910 RepID=A0A0H4WB13_9BACT|nr:hypothetical protein TH63_12350 [Rufibacter radiotolerans]